MLRRRTMTKPAIDTIIMDQTIEDPAAALSGDINGPVIQAIRAKIRRCLAKYTGDREMTIRYLRNDNSNYYDDGTASVLTGAQGDVMVYFPTFYYKYNKINDYAFSFSFALKKPDNTWKESTECLVGAYEACIVSYKVYSRSEAGSAGYNSQGVYKKDARARGNGYQLIDYDQHKIIAWLFYAIYGTRNCQSVCGRGTNSYTKSTGQTNTIGNADTKTANGNSMSVNFLGIENCWGNKYEWVDNVVVNPDSSDGVWRVTDTVTGATRDIAGMAPNGSSDCPKTVVAGTFLDLVIKEGGMSDTSGYCDLQFISSSMYRVVARSYTMSNGYGGVACADVNYNSGFSNATTSSRLAFRGKINEAASVSAFKAIPITN